MNLKGGGGLETLSVRVLVVDDYEAFRRLICSTLRTSPELQIVDEASDGLEAVRKVEELQPDLIVLDIGLPTLNGIEVARRIRTLCPECKILFVSQESCADVVQETLSLGALGYVVKAHAGSELLAAAKAVCEGRQYLSRGTSGHNGTHATEALVPRSLTQVGYPVAGPEKRGIARNHDVEFYADDAAFVVGFAGFIEGALNAGSAVIAVVTESHRKSLLQSLQEKGVDCAAAMEQGRYTTLDVAETLSRFMVNDLPDPLRFFKVVGDLIGAAARATGREPSEVTICGECASILWAQGKADAAIQLERFCSQLTKRYEMGILCGFSLSSFFHEADKQIFHRIGSESLN